MIQTSSKIETIKKIRYLTRLSQRAFGKEFDVSGTYIGQIETGLEPSEKIYNQVVEKYGYLLNDNKEDEDCITIDHIHINPSCGHGTVVMDEAEVTPIKLGTQMIQSVLKVSNPQNLKIFKACGDSMTSVIEDGDLLLVDTGRKDFNNGGIFLLTINNDWYVKRLRKRLSGELDVISDNTHYPIETFEPDSPVEISVMGRVVKNLSRGL